MTPDTSQAAERRQLTILFCDLVGSTQLSVQLDPEEYHALLNDYRSVCISSIERYGGAQIRFVGDGTQAYFGYPVAQEDAAERAVLASLQILHDIGQLGTRARWSGCPPAVRIGIGTGPVITNYLSSRDESGVRQAEAVGETPNLAARIQSVAAENAIAIGPFTRRLLGRLFLLEDLGTHVLKGIAEPVRVWQVLGRTPVDRFDATRSSAIPLINQKPLLSALEHCWSRARAGQGRVFVISGEGGIGKSRIIRTFRNSIRAREPTLGFYLHCSSIHRNTVLHPVAAFMDSDSATPGIRQRRHLMRLARHFNDHDGDDETTISQLGKLVSGTGGVQEDLTSVDWQYLRDQLKHALVRHLASLSARRPLLLVVEDLQWIDPTSSELLEWVVRSVNRVRILLVVTCRSETLMPWFRLAHVQYFAVERLSARHTRQLAREVAGPRPLPPDVLDRLVANTDGIPLFVEESVKSLVQPVSLEQGEPGLAVNGAAARLTIPATLTDSLMARLDQLGPHRVVVQHAAIIGGKFSEELLARVLSRSPAEVKQSIDVLVDAGLLQAHRSADGIEYSFRHPMMQEVASEALLRGQRKRMHEAVARALEDDAVGGEPPAPEVLAHHFAEAQQVHQAVVYWLLAGRRASAQSANVEAINHLQHALDAIASTPPDDRLMQSHLDVLIALGPPRMSVLGPGDEAVRDTYRAALDLCENLPESAAHFAAYWGWWRISKDFGEKDRTAERLLALAQQLCDPGLELEANHALWATRFALGDQPGCLEYITRGLDLYCAGDYRHHASIYGGHDARVCAEGEAALTLWLMGQTGQATERMQTARELADELGHFGSQAHALDYELMLNYFRRDSIAVRLGAEALVALSVEHRFSDYGARAQVFLGWADGAEDKIDSGLRAIRLGLSTQQRSGTTEDFPIFFCMQAELLLKQGSVEEARSALDEAVEYAREHNAHLWNAEICRWQAIVEQSEVRGGGVNSASIEQLKRALKTAGEQGALQLQHRACATTFLMFRDDVEASVLNAALLSDNVIGPSLPTKSPGPDINAAAPGSDGISEASPAGAGERAVSETLSASSVQAQCDQAMMLLNQRTVVRTES